MAFGSQEGPSFKHGELIVGGGYQFSKDFLRLALTADLLLGFRNGEAHHGFGLGVLVRVFLSEHFGFHLNAMAVLSEDGPDLLQEEPEPFQDPENVVTDKILGSHNRLLGGITFKF